MVGGSCGDLDRKTTSHFQSFSDGSDECEMWNFEAREGNVVSLPPPACWATDHSLDGTASNFADLSPPPTLLLPLLLPLLLLLLLPLLLLPSHFPPSSPFSSSNEGSVFSLSNLEGGWLHLLLRQIPRSLFLDLPLLLPLLFQWKSE